MTVIVAMAGACERPPATPSPPCSADSAVPTPPWSEPAAGGHESVRVDKTAPSRAARETTRIAADTEPDPVDRALGPRARRRISTLSFHRAPAREALRAMAEIGDFSIVIPDGVADREITINLRDVSLGTAMRAILAAAHLEASGLGDGVVAVQPAGAGR